MLKQSLRGSLMGRGQATPGTGGRGGSRWGLQASWPEYLEDWRFWALRQRLRGAHVRGSLWAGKGGVGLVESHLSDVKT